MRVALILAVLAPVAVLLAWWLARPIVRRRLRQRHLAQLEEENARLDSLLSARPRRRV